VQIECKVRQVIETGSGGGASNLVICEILVMHVSEDVLDENGRIDQHKIRLVGRLGGNHYVRAFGDALFDVEKPLSTMGLGIDALPEKIRNSKFLTGNDLGKLGNVELLPSDDEVSELKRRLEFQRIFQNSRDPEKDIYIIARKYLDEGKAIEALKVLMIILS